MRRLALHAALLVGVGGACGVLGYFVGRGLRTLVGIDWAVAGTFDLGTLVGLVLVVGYLGRHERAVDALDGWWSNRHRGADA